MQREDKGREGQGVGSYGGLSGEDRLTTEDLARPREDLEAGTGAASAPDEPPVFPGEATATGQAEDMPESSAATVEEEPLLGPEEAEGFGSRWQAIQTDFVDDPQDAVRAAGLEGQWGRGEEVVTEDLRVALQRYRSFFNRLLST
ncbi:hypothetical protein QMK19_31730 [Streptomyces sp. H10-C2]|uniref:hypothetical protein n=1 Tax=unclassified Streptomyces TaxID=2593676 RepID=UPI0024BAE5C1|nr:MULTISPECIES: hypothetical protein [unclassified Streptomyces]MDJ0346774.1 hypothetical protein [Streptomyces sp. PH10-H1]MDJ0374084.1 hypothetical protein [Streptomyces sp. H10-C2]